MGHDIGRDWRRALQAALRPASLLVLVAILSGCTTNYHGRGIQYKIEPLYSVDDPQFLRSMGQLLGPPIVGGNRIIRAILASSSRWNLSMRS